MIPNFEPQEILPKLTSLVRLKISCCSSANLAPGKNYAGGMKKKSCPQYDNPQTRDWLMAFLLDLGIEKSDGGLKFESESVKSGLKRIVAHFYFGRARQVKIEDEIFNFKSQSEKIRLNFFSYRYTSGTR